MFILSEAQIEDAAIKQDPSYSFMVAVVNLRNEFLIAISYQIQLDDGFYLPGAPA